MFETLKQLPPDPILGLTEAFKADPNPAKINLGVGIYKDESGNTPIMDCVKKAETLLLQKETTKNYLPIPGSNEYGLAVRKLVFGQKSPLVNNGAAITAQTPGGTAALKVAADLIKKILPDSKLWLSDPTWENHMGIFSDAGFEIEIYPYYDPKNKNIDLDKMLAALKNVAPNDLVLLHGCCHNPTGMDPDIHQWQKIADVLLKTKAIVLFDFAYQGLGAGLDEDAAGIRLFTEQFPELIIASSFSKNFGLYNERVGALTIKCDSPEIAQIAFSHLKTTIRRNYSNPPSHGSSIVATIIGDPNLNAIWIEEVAQIRNRINQMRKLFEQKMNQRKPDMDFSFITKQNGMFSLTGLTKDQVEKLKKQYAIYIVGSGRVNVAAISTKNIDPLCNALAAVL